ncbi:MAG: DUF4298 domain-containing protein [Ruminococcaceae bacterium]|nr:DUF4298 domain-containing protein [Oscillospiraceae bacterium]
MIIYFAVKRIKKMETYFDTLSDAFKNAPNTIAADKGLRKMLKSLTKYYEGGKWRKDYELDEKKLLEPTLKRGVLSEDGVYNFLCDYKRFLKGE